MKPSRIIFLVTLLFTSPVLFAQSWQTLADVPVKLAFPVVLPLNGNIHVIGGGAPSGATNLHLRYTPSTNKWDTMPPVPYLAQQPAGAVVRGKIHYMGGGYPNSGTRVVLHYFYDPDSNKWFPAANLPIAQAIHKGASANGKLYSLTGQPDKTLAMVYDPDSDKWTTNNPLPDQNFWYGAIVSHNNQVYRFGGGAYFAPSSAAHQYNVASDSWTSLPALPAANHGIDGAGIGDSIYLVGGYSSATEQSKVWIYNTVNQTYYPGVPMPLGRNYHGVVAIDKCIYAVGGNNNAHDSIGTSLIRFCPSFSSGINEYMQADQKGISIANDGDNIVIRIDGSRSNDLVRVRMYDLTGRLILSSECNAGPEGTIRFPRSQFNQVYGVVQVTCGEKNHTARVVLGEK